MIAPAHSDSEIAALTRTRSSVATARPPRVLHFHSSQGLYGPERWTHLLLRNASPRHLELEVLTIGSKSGYDEFSQFLRSHGFTAHHLAISGKIGLEAVRKVRELILERRIDILHTHGFKSDIIGYLATRRLPVALVTTPHGWCDHENLRIRAYEMVGRGFLHGFDRIYPLSDHQTDFLRRRSRLRGRLRCIRNAVDVDAFTSTFERRLARPIDDRAPLLFVGRLGHEKGIFDLLHALHALAVRHPNLTLLVVGTGPDAERAEQLATELGLSSHVTFLGFQEDVRPYLECASALVLPSYSEGIPRVVMEAFAAGVPVIGSDIPGIRELVRDGRTGFTVPVARPAALADAVDAVLRDPRRGREIAAEARELIERDYTPVRMADELLDEYVRLAAAK